MKLSITSPIIVLVGPFRPAVPRVAVVVDLRAKADASIDIALGGKRAHRARIASARPTSKRVRSFAR